MSVQDRILEVFQLFDTNSNGVISRSELSSVLSILDPAIWNSHHIEKLMSVVDVDCDGQIQYREFVNWFSKSGDDWAGARQDFLKISETSELNILLHKLFSLYDADGDGEIQCGEFVEAHDILMSIMEEEESDVLSSMAQFFELTSRGPFQIDSFLEWQVGLLADSHSSESEMVAEIRQKVNVITQERNGSKDGARDSSSVFDHPGIDLDMRAATKQLRELRNKRRTASKSEMEALRAEEEALCKRMRELWSQRREEFGGKLIVRGLVVSEGKKITSVEVILSLAGHSVASTSTDAEGKFELSVDAQRGRSMNLSARKTGFATVTRRIGGEGMRTISLELVPLAVREMFAAKHGARGTVEFVHKGAKFDLPIGELLKDGEPFSGQAEFNATIINAAAHEGTASMPPLRGRSAGGGVLPFNSMGTVFTSIIDPTDGKELKLNPDGRGIFVNVPSESALPRAPPSVWHYEEISGQWQQRLQPVVINGNEFEAPDPDQVPDNKVNVVEEGSAEEQKCKNDEIQGAREVLDEQRKQSSEPKVCTCGFKAKSAIMPIVRERFGLEHAEPPKRIFASTVLDETGHVGFAFPYLTEEETISSAEKAAQNSEVILSHHLGIADEAMNMSSKSMPSKAGKMPLTKYYTVGARDYMPSLLHVVEYLINGAHMMDEKTQEAVDDMNWPFIHLKALEKLASFWLQGTSRTPCPSLAELQEALEDYSLFGSGPDANAVAEAFLSVAARQALLEDVACVRAKLKEEDSRHTAVFHVVEHALDSADGDVDRAVALLLGDPAVSLRLEKVKLREELYQKLPMAHPTSQQLEDALADANGDPDRAADMLKANPDVQEGAKQVYDTWRGTLVEANSTNNFGWQIYDPGWNSLGSYVDLVGAIQEYGAERVALEFYPAERNRVCPIGDSSMVLGAFDDGVFAAKATAVNLEYKGVNYSEDVQPDGSFCLTALARGQFEVQTTKMDGTASFSYGPFNPNDGFAALRRNDVIHLGLLVPHRVDDLSWDSLASNVKVVLPVLEFPNEIEHPLPEPDEECDDPDAGPDRLEPFLGEWSYTLNEEQIEDAESFQMPLQGTFTLERGVHEGGDYEGDDYDYPGHVVLKVPFWKECSSRNIWDEDEEWFEGEYETPHYWFKKELVHEGGIRIHIHQYACETWYKDSNGLERWAFSEDGWCCSDPEAFLPRGVLHAECFLGAEKWSGDVRPFKKKIHFLARRVCERCTCFD